MNVTVCSAKILKLFIESEDMCIYIIDSGYVKGFDGDDIEFKYHVIIEDAYGESKHSVLCKKEIESKYGIKLDLYIKDGKFRSEEEIMNDTLDLMLLERKK